jgi:uncharacterized membrane protein HdeD (DUF308 family)
MSRSTIYQTNASLFPWWMGLIEGIAAVVIGLFLVISPGMTTLVLVPFLGFFWVVSGMISLMDLFRDRAMWGWKVCGGILGLLAGLVVIRSPLWSAVFLPFVLIILLGIDALIQGIVKFGYAFRGGGMWAIVLGILNSAFGIILLASPLLSALVLILVIGIAAILGGSLSIIAALRQRMVSLPSVEPRPG